MDDDGLSMRRRRLAYIVAVGAVIIFLVLLFTPSKTVSYNKAVASTEKQDTPEVDLTIEPAATSTDLMIGPETAEIEPEEPDQPTVEPIPVYDAETERVLKAIAICESGDRHYRPDGSIVKNPNSSAIGRYQLMASIWHPVGLSMGIDIYTPAGNKRMAYHVLTVVQGIQAWEASASCLARHNVFIQ